MRRSACAEHRGAVACIHMIGPELLLVDPTLNTVGKLLFAALLGAIMGTERGVLARQAAGTRTFALVALGSCLLVATSMQVDLAYLGYSNFDPMRVAAAIVQGIGFIGAGIIIFRGTTVHGTTTAAGLWMAAAVGIAVGYGFYTLAMVSTLITLIVLVVMWYIENRFKQWFAEKASQGDEGMRSS